MTVVVGRPATSVVRTKLRTGVQVCLLAAVCSLAACGNVVEDTRPGQPVKTRQKAFKEILRTFEPMGTMLRDGRYDPDRFAAMAEDLMLKRDAPWTHFGADTNYPPTKARAEVWTQPESFELARLSFFKSTDELLVSARTRQKAAAEKAYYAAYDSCQSCHKHFKEK